MEAPDARTAPGLARSSKNNPRPFFQRRSWFTPELEAARCGQSCSSAERWGGFGNGGRAATKERVRFGAKREDGDHVARSCENLRLFMRQTGGGLSFPE